MNIRPKNMILYAETGVKFSQNNLGGANWRQQVFENYRQHLLDQLAKYGNVDDYGNWLNEMQSRHAQIYNLAGKNFENTAYKNNLVGQYQHDYRGSGRFGKIKINNEDKYNFNIGIQPNQFSRYIISNPPKRTSGDFLRTGHEYDPDNLYSAITDDRRLLGRKGDWDDTNAFNEFNSQLNKHGWEMYLDKDNYYKLRRTDPLLNLKPIKPMSITPPDQKLQIPDTLIKNEIEVGVGDGDKEEKTVGFDWNKIKGSLQKSIPGIIEGVRLVGNHIANEKIYDEALKGIRPDLMQSYNTYRQVVGDEATKQAYYRRAIQGQTRAARPFTSDADKQMAYQFEAKRVGDELKAQGDLADNQRIRETSEQSSQHLDANRQRATEVANANNKAINYANSLKHNLLAQKHAAQWSSVDNYLQGLANEYKANNERNKQWNLQAWLLQREGEIENDVQLADLRKQFDIAAAKPQNQKLDSFGYKVVNYDSDEIRDLVQKIKNRNRELQFETFQQRRVLFGKSGTKVTVKRKKKNDLLYKSTRDTVEHFRKISKMSSDAQNRKRIKIDKLAPYPKGTKKYQQGGLAPFLVYKPTILGGETTTTTQTDSSSGKSSKSGSSTDQEIDLLKDLFKNLAVEGLPSDTNIIYSSMMELMNRRKLFGNSLSSSDIESMYIHQLEKINTIKYNKAQFDKVSEIVHNKNADSEIAIDSLGRIAVQNLENKEVEYKRLEDLEKGKYVPLTNKQLLDLRAISPNMAFDSGQALQTAANATSMQEIAKFLKEQLPSIESSESVIEGYTKRESNNIKEGLRQLLYDAPSGDYKYTVTDKNNSEQIKSALEYLKNVLPNNMKNYLEIKSGGRNPDKLIVDLLSSKFESTQKTEFQAVTGKASNGTNGTGSDKSNLELNYALKLLNGIGDPKLESFGIGNNNSFQALGRASVIANTSEGEQSFGADFSYNEIYKSGVGKILNLDNACFGDVPINKAMKDSIIVDNDKIVGVDLPYTRDKNGRIIPDFRMLNRIEEADKEVMKQNLNPENPADIDKINQIYANKNLPIKYNSSNKLSGNYMRFAVIQATANEDVFLSKDGLSSNRTLTLVTDDNEIEKYKRLMGEITKDKKYSLSRSGMFNFGNKDIYKGSIFIPITGDITDAALAGGASKMTTGMSTNQEVLRSAWNTRNYIAPPEQNISK